MNLSTVSLIYSSIKGVLKILPGGETQSLSGKLEQRATPARSLIPKDNQYFTPSEAAANARRQEQKRGSVGGRGPWR